MLCASVVTALLEELAVAFTLSPALTVADDSVHRCLVSVNHRSNALDRFLDPGTSLSALLTLSENLGQTFLPLGRILASGMVQQESSLLLRLVGLEHRLLECTRLLGHIMDRWLKVGKRAVIVLAACGDLLCASLVEGRQNGIESIDSNLTYQS